MTKTTESLDGVANFILGAIDKALTGIETSNMATITAIDKTRVDVTIDSSKQEVPDIPFFTLQGGTQFLQFPIKVGDKCLVIFSKSTVETWIGGETEYNFSDDFDINNGFAFVGINNDNEPIAIQDYTDFKIDKIKIRNENEELITLLSDTTQALSDVSDTLSVTSVIIPGGSSSGTYPLSTSSNFIILKATIDELKTKLDTFKV